MLRATDPMTHPRRLPAPSPRPRPGPEAAPPARAAKDPAAAPTAWIPTVRTLVGVTAAGADRTGDQRTRECVRRHWVAWKVAWRASQGSSTSCLIGLSVAAGRVTVASARSTVATASRHGRGAVSAMSLPVAHLSSASPPATPAVSRQGVLVHQAAAEPWRFPRRRRGDSSRHGFAGHSTQREAAAGDHTRDAASSGHSIGSPEWPTGVSFPSLRIAALDAAGGRLGAD